MGHNIDLQWLLGLPNETMCPICNNMTGLDELEEYDIDCGSPQAINGIMTFFLCCHTCEKDFEYYVKVKPIEDGSA